jgi:IS5 family transposase
MKITTKPRSFFDEDFKLEKIDKLGDPLVKINKYIDWESFRPQLERTLSTTDPKLGGRPHYDRVMMFKILILQRLYSLSDTTVEYVINDRISFQRFLGLNISDTVPDANTIWTFRENLNNSGILENLFDLFNIALTKRGFVTRQGSIIDATIVEAPVQRNSRDENKKLKEGGVPDEWSKNKRSQKDTEAAWTQKGNKQYFGYKDHVEVDKDSKLIVNYIVSPANVADIDAGEELIDGISEGVKELYADRGYPSAKMRNKLRERKIEDNIMLKKDKNKDLSEEDEAKNKSISKIRCRVEHVFGQIKNGKKKYIIMCRGLQRAFGQITLMNIGYNLQRVITLMKAKKELCPICI